MEIFYHILQWPARVIINIRGRHTHKEPVLSLHISRPIEKLHMQVLEQAFFLEKFSIVIGFERNTLHKLRVDI